MYGFNAYYPKFGTNIINTARNAKFFSAQICPKIFNCSIERCITKIFLIFVKLFHRVATYEINHTIRLWNTNAQKLKENNL